MWKFHHQFVSAIDALSHGGVIAYPTEGVWGLGCNPFNGRAVESILAIKSRPWQKGLILISGDIRDFDFILNDLSQQEYQRLTDSWPGHNTWLVPHKDRVPEWVTGQHDTVAIRVSSHPLVREVCEAYGGAIVSTSANPAGKPSAKTGVSVRKYFRDEIRRKDLFLMPGQVGKAKSASTIRRLSDGKILR